MARLVEKGERFKLTIRKEGANYLPGEEVWHECVGTAWVIWDTLFSLNWTTPGDIMTSERFWRDSLRQCVIGRAGLFMTLERIDDANVSLPHT